MKKFLIVFAVFLVWSFFGLWLYSWLQPNNDILKIKHSVASTVSEENLKKVVVSPPVKEKIIVHDIDEDSVPIQKKQNENYEANASRMKIATQSGEILFLFSEGIVITKDSPEIEIPVNSIDVKYKLNTYLIEHPDQELHVISLYSATENTETPNLGIQRAKKIKDVLIDTGIPSEKIVIKSHIRAIDFTAKNNFNNGISFIFKPIDSARINATRNKIPDSKIIYPTFSNSSILVNDALKNLLQEVIEIVQEKPDITIEIVGHTDNIGNDIDNYGTGLEYARQVRWYLIAKSDINKTQIVASSKGETEPIESNGTTFGRNTNRRIEVHFY